MHIQAVSYQSPILKYDALAGTVIIAHRDTQTGEISQQIPSEGAVDAQRRAAGIGAAPSLSILI
jgi:uncharacterized FlaG/YvyC family protein